MASSVPDSCCFVARHGVEHAACGQWQSEVRRATVGLTRLLDERAVWAHVSQLLGAFPWRLGPAAVAATRLGLGLGWGGWLMRSWQLAVAGWDLEQAGRRLRGHEEEQQTCLRRATTAKTMKMASTARRRPRRERRRSIEDAETGPAVLVAVRLMRRGEAEAAGGGAGCGRTVGGASSPVLPEEDVRRRRGIGAESYDPLLRSTRLHTAAQHPRRHAHAPNPDSHPLILLRLLTIGIDR